MQPTLLGRAGTVETTEPLQLETIVPGRVAALAAADFDGDGVIDLALADSDARLIHVLLIDWGGGVKSHSTYSVGPIPRTLVAGDLDGDGSTDLAVGCLGAIHILQGDGSGGFHAGPVVEVKGSPTGLAAEVPPPPAPARLLAAIGGRVQRVDLPPAEPRAAASIVDRLMVASQARRFLSRADGLTSREDDIVRLAVEGLAAKQIALRLSISTRTVESHLAHVYAKLGISSRFELVRWVQENRLTS